MNNWLYKAITSILEESISVKLMIYMHVIAALQQQFNLNLQTCKSQKSCFTIYSCLLNAPSSTDYIRTLPT